MLWLFGVGLAGASVLPVLYFLGLLVWQFALRVQGGSWVRLPASLAFTDHQFPFLPELPSGWLASLQTWPPMHVAATAFLEGVHIGLVFAAPALLLMGLGALIALRQVAVIRTEKRRKEDRLRRIRVQQYRDQGGERVEPFIGPDDVAESQERKKEAA